MGLTLLRNPADRRAVGFFFTWAALVAVQWNVDLPLPLAVLAWVATAWMAFVGALSAHYTVHLPLFHRRSHNRIWQVLASVWMGYPASAFVPAHNLTHHLHLQTATDPLRTNQVRSGWNLRDVLVFSGRASLHMLRTDLVYFARMRRRHPRWFRQVVIEAVCTAGFVLGLVALDPGKGLAYVVLPHLIGLRGIVVLGYLQHDGCDEAVEGHHSRNFTGRLLNWATLNSGLHTVHHEQPGLHWSALAEAHAATVATRHPGVDEPSVVAYCWRAFVWPGTRLRYDGKPVVLGPIEPPSFEAPMPEQLPGVSLGAAR